MIESHKLSFAVKNYYKDPELTVPVYKAMTGKTFVVLNSRSKWHRLIHLIKYTIHWPGYRAKFQRAVEQYYTSFDNPSSSFSSESQNTARKVHNVRFSLSSDSKKESAESSSSESSEEPPAPKLESSSEESVDENPVESSETQPKEEVVEDKPVEKPEEAVISEDKPAEQPEAPLKEASTSEEAIEDQPEAEPVQDAQNEEIESSSEEQVSMPIVTTDQPLALASSPENSEEDEVAPAAVEEAPGVPMQVALNSKTEQFLEMIQKKLNPQAATLWRTLFTTFANAYGKDVCTECAEDKNKVLLTFAHPLMLHTLSTDERNQEDPYGGVVLIFAKEGQLRLKFEKAKMVFEKGYNTVSLFPKSIRDKVIKIPFKGVDWADKIIDGEVVEFFQSKNGFTSAAKGPLGTSIPREKPYEAIVRGWSENATVLILNQAPHVFLDQKIAERKKALEQHLKAIS
ncbi:MAG: hypothetical protein ACK5MA_05655 [Parachlamydiaceae bacterium]